MKKSVLSYWRQGLVALLFGRINKYYAGFDEDEKQFRLEVDGYDENKKDDVLRLFDLIERHILHEYELVNHRLGWFLASQAFLLGSCIQNIADLRSSKLLLVSLSFLSVLASFALLRGTSAAHAEIRRLTPRREIIYNKLGNAYDLRLGPDRITHKIGLSVPPALILLVTAAWLVMLSQAW